jgi:hypothetical protein
LFHSSPLSCAVLCTIISALIQLFLPPGIFLYLQHTEDEYGTEVDEQGRHYGGPFTIHISPKMRIEELRLIIRVRELGAVSECTGGLPIFYFLFASVCLNVSKQRISFNFMLQDKGGIIPALQRLSYAGKNLEDSQRTLEQ